MIKKILGILGCLLIAGTAYAQPVQIQTFSVTKSSTPTVSSGVAYTAGDNIGGKITITDAVRGIANSGIIHSVLISDLASQGADIDILVFDSDPSGTTFTDNGALDIVDADLPKIACVIQVTNDSAFADNGVSFANGTNCVFKAGTGTTIYLALVARGTPTYGSTSDLTVRLGILQD